MSSSLYQHVKIACQSSTTSQLDKDGHRMRNWKVTLVAMDNGKEAFGKLEAMLDHVEYILHPTFVEPKRDFNKEPYLLEENGWGEFDLRVTLYFKDDFAPSELFLFDLNFRKPRYSETRRIKFLNLPPKWTKVLTHFTLKKPTENQVSGASVSSSLPDEETCLAWDIPIQFDMMELSRRLALLSEWQVADLYALIQSYQTDTMTINKENDQLTMDLYSLGTPLLKRIWEFTETISKDSNES